MEHTYGWESVGPGRCNLVSQREPAIINIAKQRLDAAWNAYQEACDAVEALPAGEWGTLRYEIVHKHRELALEAAERAERLLHDLRQRLSDW